MKLRFLAGVAPAALTVLLASGASAQEAGTPTRLHGAVTGVEGRVVALDTREGGAAKLELAPNARVFAMAAARADAIATML